MLLEVEALDYNIKHRIRTMLFDRMLEFGDESYEEFKAALNSGLRDEVISEVKEYYASLGAIEFNPSDDELYKMYKEM